MFESRLMLTPDEKLTADFISLIKNVFKRSFIASSEDKFKSKLKEGWKMESTGTQISVQERCSFFWIDISTFNSIEMSRQGFRSLRIRQGKNLVLNYQHRSLLLIQTIYKRVILLV